MNVRPVISSARPDVAGRSGLTKSIVSSDAAAFSALSRLDMMAASSAVSTSPRKPTGSSSKASTGNTRSGLSRSGSRTSAIMPGTIIRNTLGSFNNPPNSAPLRPASNERAASARCTKY